FDAARPSTSDLLRRSRSSSSKNGDGGGSGGSGSAAHHSLGSAGLPSSSAATSAAMTAFRSRFLESDTDVVVLMSGSRKQREYWLQVLLRCELWFVAERGFGQ